MILAVLLAACQGDVAPEAPSAVVSDSVGIRIVENPAPDPTAPWSPVKVADLVTPDSALTAVPWGVGADPATGRIYVLDWTGERVVVFDRSGAYVETYGRQGGGPGEFQDPAALSVAPDGAVTVWDGGRGVLSRWSGRGELVDERRAPVALWGPAFYDGPGGLVTVTSRTSDREMRQMLIELAGRDTTVLHTVPRDLVPMELPCGSRPGHRIFAPDVIWTARGGTVYVRNGPEYRIDAYADGALVSSVRRPGVEPIRVTEAMAAQRARFGPYGGFLRMCGVTPEQLVAEIGHVERISAIVWIAVGPDERLWVSRSSNGVLPETVDRFDAEGRYEGTVALDAMPVAFLSASRFVALGLRPQIGQTVLSLYELRETGDAPDGETRASAGRARVRRRVERGDGVGVPAAG